MPLFTSKREKTLWIWALIVLVTIISTLFLGQPFARELRDQNIQAVIFVLGMLLIGVAIIFHAIRTKPGRFEIALIFGIAAVYLMFFFRLGAPERSHLIEYSALSILIHSAFIERINQGKTIRMPALLAVLLSFLIGVLDESIQLLIPSRVFDTQDIVFNGLAVSMAIGSRILFIWIRKLAVRYKSNSK